MRISLATLVLGLAGCGGANSGNPPSSTNSGWILSLDPPSRLEEAQPIVAFVLTGDIEDPLPMDTILIEGEPSKVSAGKYIDGETTEALAERIVPTRLESQPGSLVMRPNHVLARAQRYTVLSRNGVLGTVVVSPSFELTYLSRVWPPRETTEATMQTIYCGDSAPAESTLIALFPGALSARLEPGLDDSGRAIGSCIRLQPEASGGQPVQPPVRLGNFAIEPSSWISGADLPEIPPLSCTASESGFGPGCLSLENGRGLVRAPASTAFWVLTSSLGWHMGAVEGGGRFVVPMIGSMSEGRLDALVFDLAGRSFFSSVRITPPGPVAHVVINEVMANPLGPEPAEEWIEIINDASVAAEMVEWKLRDQGGEVDLPPLLLEPSAIALLVRSDFVGGQAGDVAPAVGTTLVRLPMLGKNGLTNAGESLALIDASGAVKSAFPAQASEREGVSLARRSPLELDDAIQGFASHAGPGASPGAGNVVE